jgi:hypothetical protein
MIPFKKIPDLQYMPTPMYAIHLRSPSVSGGKDWVGIVFHECHNEHLFVVFGKTSDVISGRVQTRTTKDSGSITKLEAVVRKKLREGYVLIDRFGERTGWSGPNLPTMDQTLPSPSFQTPVFAPVETPEIEYEDDFVW